MRNILRVAAIISAISWTSSASALDIPDELQKDFLQIEAHAKCSVYARQSKQAEPSREHFLRASLAARSIVTFLADNDEEKNGDFYWAKQKGLIDIWAGMFLGGFFSRAEDELKQIKNTKERAQTARSQYSESNCSLLLP